MPCLSLKIRFTIWQSGIFANTAKFEGIIANFPKKYSLQRMDGNAVMKAEGCRGRRRKGV